MYLIAGASASQNQVPLAVPFRWGSDDGALLRTPAAAARQEVHSERLVVWRGILAQSKSRWSLLTDLCREDQTTHDSLEVSEGGFLRGGACATLRDIL